MHEQYDINKVATLHAFFTDDDGEPVDPTTIVLTITEPDGSTTVRTKAAAQLTDEPLVGRWSYDHQVTQRGVLVYRYDSTGPNLTQEAYLLVGMATDDGPCDSWIGPEDVFSCRPTASITEADRDYQTAAVMAHAATRMLFIRSGRRYNGICRDVVRPCRRSQWWPDTFAHGWHSSWGFCSCGARSPGACGCPSGDEIQLGGSPILGIQQVLIDGDALASSAYEVRDSRVLARIDGEGWPCCQDLTADPETDLNTFQVTYFYGRAVPEDGVIAARRLASELYLACTGNGKCQLPRRIRSLVRNGIEVGFVDPQEFFADGLLGIFEVDSFLSGDRWGQAHRGTVVASPDFGPQVRRVTA